MSLRFFLLFFCPRESCELFFEFFFVVQGPHARKRLHFARAVFLFESLRLHSRRGRPAPVRERELRLHDAASAVGFERV